MKHSNDSEAFIEYLNNLDNIYKKIEEYKADKNILILFDDMTADMLSNKNLNSIATELLITGKKRNISLIFITQSYFAVPKNIILNSTQIYYENSK